MRILTKLCNISPQSKQEQLLLPRQKITQLDMSYELFNPHTSILMNI